MNKQRVRGTDPGRLLPNQGSLSPAHPQRNGSVELADAARPEQRLEITHQCRCWRNAQMLVEPQDTGARTGLQLQVHLSPTGMRGEDSPQPPDPGRGASL